MKKSIEKRYIITKRCGRKNDYKPSAGKNILMRYFKRRANRIFEKEVINIEE